MTTPSGRGAASVESECFRAAGVIALGAAAATVLLWASTFPGWPLAAGVILSVLVFAGLLFMLGAEPVPAAGRLRPVGLVVALLVAVGGAILIEQSGDAALQARFANNRAAFETVVAEAGPPTHRSALRGDFTGDCPSRIGSFALAECHVIDRGYLFLQQRAALGGDAGFAYLPHGLPAEDPAVGSGLKPDQFSPLHGAWYAWSCGC
ncbi:MAG TPA: hypothetical protein VFR88_04955 [Microlunatus sp.]|nr:hypothetical protein [Microlunatus sp.]